MKLLKTVTAIAVAVLPLPTATRQAASASDADQQPVDLPLAVPQPPDEDGREVTSDEALALDAQRYANAFDVTQEEALSRLAAQQEASPVADKALADIGTDSFGYWGVQHSPTFKVFIGTTDPDAAKGALPDSVGGYELEVRKAPYSEAHLSKVAADIALVSTAPHDSFDYQVDVVEGVIEYHVVDTRSSGALRDSAVSLGATDDAESALKMPDGVKVDIDFVDEMAVESGSLSGGRDIDDCTSGFPIHYIVSGNAFFPAMTAAGHCEGFSLRYGGCDLPLLYANFNGNYDRMALKGGCNTMPGTFWTGGVQRRPTGWSSSMGMDTFHCKYGQTTGQDCGVVINNAYRPPYASVGSNGFVIVQSVTGEGPDMSHAGDSGGPWYSGSVATGIMSGASDTSSASNAIVSPGRFVFNTQGNFTLRATDY